MAEHGVTLEDMLQRIIWGNVWCAQCRYNFYSCTSTGTVMYIMNVKNYVFLSLRQMYNRESGERERGGVSVPLYAAHLVAVLVVVRVVSLQFY